MAGLLSYTFVRGLYCKSVNLKKLTSCIVQESWYLVLVTLYLKRACSSGG